MTTATKTFQELNEDEPCVGCPAPCCKVQAVPFPPPRTFGELDHARYLLLFPNTEMVIGVGGDWTLLKWQTCSLFVAGTCTCSVHGTAAKPKICVSYSPYDCWYKRTFVGDAPADAYRLDAARFDVWVREVVFDEAGLIVGAPSFERSQEMLAELPISPRFRMDPALRKRLPMAPAVSGQPA